MYDNSKLLKIFITSLLFITLFGCDNEDFWIPNVRVDQKLHLHTDLATLGILNAKTLPGGVNGIIIFRLSDNHFTAFDRTCPYQPSEGCAVSFNVEVLMAVCPCCDSHFELFENGSPHKGPARRPLKQYRTTVSGSYLMITN